MKVWFFRNLNLKHIVMKKIGIYRSFMVFFFLFSLFSCLKEDYFEIIPTTSTPELIVDEVKIEGWLYLKNKPNASEFLHSPLKMLSQRALDRRSTQGIALDSKDVPIDESYYSQIKNVPYVTVLAKSKWLNAIHISAPKSVFEEMKSQFSFISDVKFVNSGITLKRTPVYEHDKWKKITPFDKIDYGDSFDQLDLIKAQTLHDMGFTGNGVVVALLDAGFPNVDKLDAFQRLREQNKILGGYDFVERSTSFYTGMGHGTQVLSTIAAFLDNSYIGTAPDASFYLFRTEDAEREVPLEESLWVEAAEKADSLGVDIINSSLGYSLFDNSDYNHTVRELDGNTSFVSKGAEIAASRGMVVVVSAGNDRFNLWGRIAFPADAPSVLTVGAVDLDGNIAIFSSPGPTADGRIKPDIVALGHTVVIIDDITGKKINGYGTSFASPMIAGAIACLIQAFPNKSSIELIQSIKEGSHLYNMPDFDYGYGIPNFEKIYSRLSDQP